MTPGTVCVETNHFAYLSFPTAMGKQIQMTPGTVLIVIFLGRIAAKSGMV